MKEKEREAEQLLNLAEKMKREFAEYGLICSKNKFTSIVDDEFSFGVKADLGLILSHPEWGGTEDCEFIKPLKICYESQKEIGNEIKVTLIVNYDRFHREQVSIHFETNYLENEMNLSNDERLLLLKGCGYEKEIVKARFAQVFSEDEANKYVEEIMAKFREVIWQAEVSVENFLSESVLRIIEKNKEEADVWKHKKRNRVDGIVI